MRSLKTSFASVLVFISLAAASQATDYTIDEAHSSVTFKIKHLSISTVIGRFGKFSGTVSVDPANLSSLKTSATIEVASVDTSEPKRDEHLRSPEFFDATKYPQMTFVSKEVKVVSANRLTIAGDLTLHGVTKPVVLDTEFDGTIKDPWGSQRVAFIASTTINRKDFGMTFNKTLDSGGLMLGEEVRIDIAIEAMTKK